MLHQTTQTVELPASELTATITPDAVCFRHFGQAVTGMELGEAVALARAVLDFAAQQQDPNDFDGILNDLRTGKIETLVTFTEADNAEQERIGEEIGRAPYLW